MRLFLSFAVAALVLPQTAAPPASSPREMPGHINLRALPNLPSTSGDTVAAFPRVLAGPAVSPQIADLLNARFSRFDAQTHKQQRDCAAAEKQANHDPGSFEFDLNVTLRGPRFLSLSSSSGGDCGGAHPFDDEAGYTYDVSTGQPVSWPALLPGASADAAGSDDASQAAIQWSPIAAIALARVDKDCKDAYRDPAPPYVLWLDGDQGVLVARTAGLSHFNSEMCGVEIKLDVPTLRKLHASPLLLDALTAALHDPSPLAAERRAKAKALAAQNQ